MCQLLQFTFDQNSTCKTTYKNNVSNRSNEKYLDGGWVAYVQNVYNPNLLKLHNLLME